MKTIYKKQPHNIFSTKKETPKKQQPKEKIIIDYREKQSLVASELVRLGFEIEFKELKVADYIVKDVAIERKTIPDFISSMINNHLVNQIKELQQYEKKLLIIEGISEQEIYSKGNGVNPNSVRGFLLSILLKHKIPIMFTQNAEDTAKFIRTIANKRENQMSLNPKKKPLNKKEQLQFIIESFPGIGPKTAKKLLETFATIKNIMNAPEKELEKVLGKKAEIIKKIINENY
jgi:Fanconi anemia group M protein